MYNYAVKRLESPMPNDVRARLEAAQECQRRGDLDGAIEALRAALTLDPTIGPAHKNLAVFLARSGRLGEARDALALGAAALPRDASIWSRLARAEADVGNAAASLAALARAEAEQPRDAETWSLIAALHAEVGRWADAGRAAARASALDPGEPEIELRLARALQEQGDNPQAMQALARAAARVPGNLNVAVRERLFLPQVYADADDARRWRARYASGLERLVAESGRWDAAQVFELNQHNFLLAYQGEDDLELQRGYSRFLSGLARRAHPEWLEERRSDFDGGRRLRIGFASAIFRDCTAGRYFEHWITGLDPARFERFVYHTAPIVDDFTRRIAGASEHFATLRGGNLDSIARIAADRLDVLVQPEVGMAPLSYLLAALRLAPVQVAGWGHPVTTGSDHVDFYLTSAPMEPADAASHYAERLVMLPGLGVDYPMPEAPAAAPRAALGLAEGQRIYVCPQSLFKIHPEMDALFARIAAADEDAVLLFFQAPARVVSEQFAARVQSALVACGVPARGQVKLLPRMSAAEFRRVLATADVVLDTVRWSGGNTSLDALAASTPIVTLPGRFMRARQTAAMLGLIGLGELVASTTQEYVRLAVDVARDRSRNRALREAIVARRGALFDRPEPVAQLGESLLAMAARTRP
jgi:predicted O-linked N-acetylglucosamine transferase (SPINDLY family)